MRRRLGFASSHAQSHEMAAAAATLSKAEHRRRFLVFLDGLTAAGSHPATFHLINGCAVAAGLCQHQSVFSLARFTCVVWCRERVAGKLAGIDGSAQLLHVTSLETAIGTYRSVKLRAADLRRVDIPALRDGVQAYAAVPAAAAAPAAAVPGSRA